MNKIYLAIIIFAVIIVGVFIFLIKSDLGAVLCTMDCRMLCDEEKRCCIPCVASSCSNGKDANYFIERGFMDYNNIAEFNESDRNLISRGLNSSQWTACKIR